MSLDNFISKYNGKYVEVSGSANAKFQCVDAANLYIREVLGQPIIEWTNAVDFPSKAGSKYQYIVNTPTGIPLKGDLIIWKPSPGHIAVFIEGNVNRFSSFDQNFPVGSVCHIQEHSYVNVTGWLRFKATTDYKALYEATLKDKEALYQDKIALLNTNREVRPILEGIVKKLKT